jgi:hypothetical protein
MAQWDDGAAQKSCPELPPGGPCVLFLGAWDRGDRGRVAWGTPLLRPTVPLQPIDYRDQTVGTRPIGLHPVCLPHVFCRRLIPARSRGRQPHHLQIRLAEVSPGFRNPPMIRRTAFGLARAARPYSTMASQTPLADVIRQKVALPPVHPPGTIQCLLGNRTNLRHAPLLDHHRPPTHSARDPQ